MRHRPASSLEALESRIAPASITVGTVTVVTSKGTTGDLMSAAVFDTGGDGHLISLTLGAKFKGSDVMVTNSQGPGTANVGLVEATGFDLGKVVIDGDLGQINAGDAVPSTPGMTKLEVKSLGTTLATQAMGGDVDSHVQGKISTLLVHGNVGGTLNLDGPGGALGTGMIEGSLAGGTTANSGSIIVNGPIAKIGVINLIGGDGENSGSIIARGSIARAQVDGDLVGGKGSGSGSLTTGGVLKSSYFDTIIGGTDSSGGPNSGRVFAAVRIDDIFVNDGLQGGKTLGSGTISAGAGGIGLATIQSGLVGGDGKDSGSIATSGVLRKVVLGIPELPSIPQVAMKGGVGEHSGSLLSSVRIATAEINGDIIGGDGLTSGVIASDGTIGTVVVNGDIIGGNLNDLSGAIGASKAITSVTVNGNLKGGDAASSGQIVSISTLGTVTIHGDVVGGQGSQSGAIGALGNLGTITIDGALKGGIGVQSGSVLTGGSLTKMTVDSIQGGDGVASGRVGVQGNLTKLMVAHDVTGGLGNFSATIVVSGTSKNIEIGGSLIANAGDAANGTAAPIADASVACFGPINNIHVGGSLLGQGDHSGSIYSTGKLSTVLVDGSLVGGAQSFSGSIFTERVLTDAVAAVQPIAIPNGAPIGSVTVLGGLTGGGGQVSGSIRSVGDLGKVSVEGIGSVGPGPALTATAGGVTGGGGIFSGLILATGNIGTIHIVGSLSAGPADESGQISAGGNIKSITIDGSILGNAANYDLDNHVGQVNAVGTIQSITVGSNVVGGRGNYGGTIAGGSIGTVTIDGSLFGGNGAGAGSIFALTGDIKTVNIGGDIVTKAPLSTQPARSAGASGSIAAMNTIGTITVQGEVQGLANAPVIISAGGKLNPTTDAQALAIKSVRVAGVMGYTQVLAGYSIGGAPVNGDVQIGTIDVGTANLDFPAGFWHDNDVIAGFATSQSTFGNGGDFAINNADSTRLLSKIAKIVVRGDMGGSVSLHGIEAELVSSIVVNGVAENLKAGPNNDYFAIEGDFSRNTFVYENPPNL